MVAPPHSTRHINVDNVLMESLLDSLGGACIDAKIAVFPLLTPRRLDPPTPAAMLPRSVQRCWHVNPQTAKCSTRNSCVQRTSSSVRTRCLIGHRPAQTRGDGCLVIVPPTRGDALVTVSRSNLRRQVVSHHSRCRAVRATNARGALAQEPCSLTNFPELTD